MVLAARSPALEPSNLNEPLQRRLAFFGDITECDWGGVAFAAPGGSGGGA